MFGLLEFGSLLALPSCQVTDGRASQSLDSKLGKMVQSKLESIVGKSLSCKLVYHHLLPQDDQVLCKGMLSQAFGLAAGHISSAKAELHQVSSLRWSLQGTREVGVIDFRVWRPSCSPRRASRTPRRCSGLLAWTGWGFSQG